MSDELKTWFIDTGVRALKTFCETAVAMIGAGAVGIMEVDWLTVGSVSLTSAIICILTCVATIPIGSGNEDS